MTTKHSGGERDEAVELANRKVSSSVGDDMETDEYKIACALLAEIKSREKAEKELTAARERIEQLQARISKWASEYKHTAMACYVSNKRLRELQTASTSMRAFIKSEYEAMGGDTECECTHPKGEPCFFCRSRKALTLGEQK